MRNKIFFYTTTVVLSASLMVNVGLWLEYKKVIPEVKVAKSKYRLLSPTLDSLPIDNDKQEEKTILHFFPLKTSIEDNLASSNLAAEQKVGIYIQNINSGGWLGINERYGFMPASLLKIPIAMAVYKKIEDQELKLAQDIVILKDDIDYGAGVPDRFEIGKAETVAGLLELMIKESDNTAKNALKRQLSPEELNTVFVHVGISNPYIVNSDDYVVTPRGYSRLFKSLYFSSFLNPANSQAILDLATDTRVENLISEALPWEVQVAHKYGERNDSLHDCGIVYHPVNPYFLCIMTSGIAIPQAENLITDISREIYNFVDKESKS